jgi:hypothetical protein
MLNIKNFIEVFKNWLLAVHTSVMVDLMSISSCSVMYNVYGEVWSNHIHYMLLWDISVY